VLVDTMNGPTAHYDPAVQEPAIAAQAAGLLSTMPSVLEAVYRTHLRAAARQRIVEASREEGASTVLVGFADLVGFTAMSQQVSEVELANIVGLFEDLVFDVITAQGGRVVKTIGDEVMFAVGDPNAAAEIALALVEGTRAEEDLSDVRVGLASGAVLEREGDLYGPVVNLASRMVELARPGSVLTSDDVHAALAGNASFGFQRLRSRKIRDIGRVEVWLVESVREPEHHEDQEPVP